MGIQPSGLGNVEVRIAGARQMLRAPPSTPAQLHRWIARVLNVRIAWRARVAGHASPFHYLCHAFFEEQRMRRHAVVWASRGSGKTMLGALATLLDMIFKPGMQIAILGGSFAQSLRMHNHLCRMLREAPLRELVAGEITRTGVSLCNGSRVEIVSQSHRSVRGLRVHRLRCDEVELFSRDLWDAAQMITRSGRCGTVHVHAGVEALSTMHLPFGLMKDLVHRADSMNARLFTWNVIDVLETCPPSRACASCALFDREEGGCHGVAKPTDEPRLHSPGFFRIDDAIDMRARVGPEVWRSEMLCAEPDVSDSVYPSFEPSLHVFSDAQTPRNDASIRWIGGIDFGFRAPTVILFAMLDGANVLHVVDEVVEREVQARDLIALTRQRLMSLGVIRVEFFGVDPAGLQRSDQTGVSTISLWRTAGFTMRTRSLSIDAGIMAVRARLRSGDRIGLRVHRRCVHLIRSLSEYHYPPNRERELPPMKNGPDHACDALRYMIVNLDAHDAGVQVASYV